MGSVDEQHSSSPSCPMCEECGGPLSKTSSGETCPACALFENSGEEQQQTIGLQMPEGATQPHQTIGPYRILELLGEGAFGKVFLAEQREPVRRKVALKVIAGIGEKNPDILARFQAERQSLAVMDHPNIASVYDAGETEDGRPYFAMEWVRGIPIVEYCESQGMEIEQRLQLFLQLTAGIQHAHQKGVIHRDLKPSNILVSEVDGEPVVKVIDFGVAKALTAAPMAGNLNTVHGQVIGTPQYMSPEQGSGRSREVDARSDVYSLGVILYELLTGSTPVQAGEFSGADITEIGRLICDVDPPRPSRRLISLRHSGDGTVNVGQENLGRLIRRLQQDLDWITLHCIEKEPSRRYETADALGQDVRRYLANEPVQATPPSTVYRVKKFVRRNRAATVGIISVSLALIAGIIGSSIQAVRATNAERDSDILERASRSRAIATSDPRRALEFSLDAAEEALQRKNQSLQAPALDSLLHALETGRQIGQFSSSGPIEDCLIRQDGKTVSYASGSNLLVGDRKTGLVSPVFNVGAERLIQEILEHPDGKTLAVGCDNGSILLVKDGGQVIWESPTAHKSAVVGLAWSKDGKQLFSCGAEGVLRIWDTLKDSQTAVREIELPIDQVGAFAVSQDGVTVAVSAGIVAGKSGAWIVNLQSGEITRLGNSEDVYHALAFDPKSNQLAGAGENRVIQLWNDKGQSLRAPIRTTHDGAIKTLAFHPREELILTGSEDGSVRAYLESGGLAFPPLQGHTREIRSICFGQFGSVVASASLDGSVRLWDTLGLQTHLPFYTGTNSNAYALLFRPDGSRLVAGDSNGRLLLFDFPSGKLVREVKAHGGICEQLLPIPNGEGFVSVSFLAGDIRVFSWDGEPVGHRLSRSDRKVTIAAISPTQPELFVIDELGTLTQFSLPDFTEISRTKLPGGAEEYAKTYLGLAVFPEANSLLLRKLTVLEHRKMGALPELLQEDGRLRGTNAHKHRLSLSRERNLVLTGGRSIVGSNRVHIYRMPDFDRVSEFNAPWNGLNVAVFSSSGKELALASNDGVMQFFTTGGTSLGPMFRTHSGDSRGAARHPTDEILATSGKDGWIRFWSFGKEAWLRKARVRLGRSQQSRHEPLTLLERTASSLLTKRNSGQSELSGRTYFGDAGFSLALPEGWAQFDPRALNVAEEIWVSVLGPEARRSSLLGAFSRGEHVDLGFSEAPNFYVFQYGEISGVRSSAEQLPEFFRKVEYEIRSRLEKINFATGIEIEVISWDENVRAFRASGAGVTVEGTPKIFTSWSFPTKAHLVTILTLGDASLVNEIESILMTAEIDPSIAPTEEEYAGAGTWLFEAMEAHKEMTAARGKLAADRERFEDLMRQGKSISWESDAVARLALFEEALALAGEWTGGGNEDADEGNSPNDSGNSSSSVFHRNEAIALSLISDTHRALKRWDDALSAAEAAIQVMESAPVSSENDDLLNQYQLGSSYRRMAIIFWSQGDMENAIEWQQKAITVVERLHEESDSSNLRLVIAERMVALGEMQTKQGDISGALLSVGKANDFLENIPSALRDDNWLWKLHQSHSALVNIHRATGIWQNEIAAAEERIAAVKRWTDTHPQNEKGQWRLALSEELLVSILEKYKAHVPDRHEEQFALHRQAIARIEAVHQDRNGESIPGTASRNDEAWWREKLANSLVGEAKRLQNNDATIESVLSIYSEAIDHVNAAILVWHKGELERLLDKIYEERGNYFHARGDYENKTADQLRRVELNRKAFERDNTPESMRRLGASLRMYADSLRQSGGDLGHIESLLEEARTLIESAVAAAHPVPVACDISLLRVFSSQFHLAAWMQKNDEQAELVMQDVLRASRALAVSETEGTNRLIQVFYSTMAVANYSRQKSLGTPKEQSKLYEEAMAAFDQMGEIQKPSAHMLSYAEQCRKALAELQVDVPQN